MKVIVQPYLAPRLVYLLCDVRQHSELLVDSVNIQILALHLNSGSEKTVILTTAITFKMRLLKQPNSLRDLLFLIRFQVRDKSPQSQTHTVSIFHPGVLTIFLLNPNTNHGPHHCLAGSHTPCPVTFLSILKKGHKNSVYRILKSELQVPEKGAHYSQ